MKSQPEGIPASDQGSTRLRVRYAETDRMGVVYHSNYLVWFEVGRCEWLRASGCSYRELEEQGIELPVIEAGCRYRRPMHYDDEVEVRTRATLLSPVRVRFDYDVLRSGETEPAASGWTIHAAIAANGRPTRLPGIVRSLFA